MSDRQRQLWVYPRVGGGNARISSSLASLNGLSPRGRGKQDPVMIGELGQRSIPAWAGETLVYMVFQIRDAVYPRVGGGNPGGKI